jgi:hypothetical protein
VLVIVLVIFLFPVAIGVPALGVFIPPLVVGGVAVLAGFSKINTGVLGLGALVAVVLDGLMQLVVGFGNALLAISVVVGATGGCAYGGKSREGGYQECDLKEMIGPTMRQVHVVLSL